MKSSCKWTLTKCLFRKKKHIFVRKASSVFELTNQNQVSETSISQIFLFWNVGPPIVFISKNSSVSPHVGLNHATAEYFFPPPKVAFGAQTARGFAKELTTDPKSWQILQVTRRFFWGDTNDGARTGFLFHPKFLFGRFFCFFEQKKRGFFVCKPL